MTPLHTFSRYIGMERRFLGENWKNPPRVGDCSLYLLASSPPRDSQGL